MSDWIKLSLEDRDRVRAGGTWAIIGGELRQVSMEALKEQVEAQVRARLPVLCERLAVESLQDLDDFNVTTSDDFTAVTLTVEANGHTASDTWPLDFTTH